MRLTKLDPLAFLKVTSKLYSYTLAKERVVSVSLQAPAENLKSHSSFENFEKIYSFIYS
jgi:hypothetical protein